MNYWTVILGVVNSGNLTISTGYQTSTEASIPLDLEYPFMLDASASIGFCAEIDDAPDLTTDHVAKFFLDGFLPFAVLDGIFVMPGLLEGGWLNIGIVVCVLGKEDELIKEMVKHRDVG